MYDGNDSRAPDNDAAASKRPAASGLLMLLSCGEHRNSGELEAEGGVAAAKRQKVAV